MESRPLVYRSITGFLAICLPAQDPSLVNFREDYEGVVPEHARKKEDSLNPLLRVFTVTSVDWEPEALGAFKRHFPTATIEPKVYEKQEKKRSRRANRHQNYEQQKFGGFTDFFSPVDSIFGGYEDEVGELRQQRTESPWPWSEFYLTNDAPKYVFDAVFRVLSKYYHPDTVKSGDKTIAEDKMRSINNAADALRKEKGW